MRMKRLFCVLLTLVLLLPLTALAERGQSVMVMPWDDEMRPLVTNEAKYDTQYCKVGVKVVQRNADGTTSEKVIFPVAFSFKYKVYVYKTDGTYSSVRPAGGIWPTVTLIKNTDYDLGLSVEKITNPDIISSNTTATTWSITLKGGLYNVTYNEVIYLDEDGNQIGEIRYTEECCFNYTISGGEASE